MSSFYKLYESKEQSKDRYEKMAQNNLCESKL